MKNRTFLAAAMLAASLANAQDNTLSDSLFMSFNQRFLLVYGQEGQDLSQYSNFGDLALAYSRDRQQVLLLDENHVVRDSFAAPTNPVSYAAMPPRFFVETPGRSFRFGPLADGAMLRVWAEGGAWRHDATEALPRALRGHSPRFFAGHELLLTPLHDRPERRGDSLLHQQLLLRLAPRQTRVIYECLKPNELGAMGAHYFGSGFGLAAAATQMLLADPFAQTLSLLGADLGPTDRKAFAELGIECAAAGHWRYARPLFNPVEGVFYLLTRPTDFHSLRLYRLRTSQGQITGAAPVFELRESWPEVSEVHGGKLYFSFRHADGVYVFSAPLE